MTFLLFSAIVYLEYGKYYQVITPNIYQQKYYNLLKQLLDQNVYIKDG